LRAIKDDGTFIARKSPIFSEKDILAFAKMTNVHPGLIAANCVTALIVMTGL